MLSWQQLYFEHAEQMDTWPSLGYWSYLGTYITCNTYLLRNVVGWLV